MYLHRYINHSSPSGYFVQKTMNSKTEEIASLYQTERDRLHRQINRKVGCAATAYDLVHDIFMRLWERSPLYAGNDAAYLSRCARNAAIDHLRAEQSRRAFANGVLPEQYAPAPASPFDILQARDGVRSMDAALAGLPKQTRHIFLLNRIHGRTFSEIASVMGVSQRTIAKHMAKAVAACQETLVD